MSPQPPVSTGENWLFPLCFVCCLYRYWDWSPGRSSCTGFWSISPHSFIMRISLWEGLILSSAGCLSHLTCIKSTILAFTGNLIPITRRFFPAGIAWRGPIRCDPTLKPLISGSLIMMTHTGNPCWVCGKPLLVPHHHNRTQITGKALQIDISDRLFGRISAPQPILNIRF